MDRSDRTIRKASLTSLARHVRSTQSQREKERKGEVLPNRKRVGAYGCLRRRRSTSATTAAGSEREQGTLKIWTSPIGHCDETLLLRGRGFASGIKFVWRGFQRCRSKRVKKAVGRSQGHSPCCCCSSNDRKGIRRRRALASRHGAPSESGRPAGRQCILDVIAALKSQHAISAVG